MEPKRLFKSRTNKIIAGVCGGLAEYFDVDPVIMRVLLCCSPFLGARGYSLHRVCHHHAEARDRSGGDGSACRIAVRKCTEIIRIALIIGGAIVLFSNLGLFSFLHMWDISWSLVFPILLILLGMAIIYYRQAERAPAAEHPADSQVKNRLISMLNPASCCAVSHIQAFEDG